MQFLVATVTPFDTRGRVDLARLRAHILWLLAQGVDGFVPTGTTGEFLYLTDREREAVHRTVLDTAPNAPVYPCTWDPSPTTTQYLTDAAREQGATAVMLPPPLYYPLEDEVVEGWYRRIHDATGFQILAYHNPKHIPSGVSSDVYARLRADGVLVGMKDSSGDIFRLQRLCDSDPGTVFAGRDRILGEAAQLTNAAGFISSLGNVWPEFCLRVFKRRETQLEEALLHRVTSVRRAGGIRALKKVLGMACRAPLVEPSDEAVSQLPSPELRA